MGVKPAKNQLLEFYHRHSGTPSFEIQPGPPPPAVPRFLCTVNIPGIDCKDGAYPAQEFIAEAKNKKASEHAASLKALEFIKSHNLLPPELQNAEAEPATKEEQVPQTLGLEKTANGNGATASPAEDLSEEAYLTQQLAGRCIDDLGPLELRDELEKALQRNTELKSELHHEEQRRQKAVGVLLGVTKL